jgi:hypothetical protein
MKNVLAHARYWVTGAFVALAGVVLARLVAPQFAHSVRITIMVGGQLLALAGLTIISVGVSRRVRGNDESSPT